MVLNRLSNITKVMVTRRKLLDQDFILNLRIRPVLVRLLVYYLSQQQYQGMQRVVLLTRLSFLAQVVAVIYAELL